MMQKERKKRHGLAETGGWKLKESRGGARQKHYSDCSETSGWKANLKQAY